MRKYTPRNVCLYFQNHIDNFKIVKTNRQKSRQIYLKRFISSNISLHFGAKNKKLPHFTLQHNLAETRPVGYLASKIQLTERFLSRDKSVGEQRVSDMNYFVLRIFPLSIVTHIFTHYLQEPPGTDYTYDIIKFYFCF